MGLIVVAEDDVDVRDLVALVMESGGHSVVVAEDGQTAIDLCERHTPDLAIFDVSMPRVTGMAALAELRSREHPASLPIILMSGYTRQVDVETAVAAGASAYVTKPFSHTALVELAERLIGPSR